ncbi:unnamed protein product [Paramecium pentaurelia]|uniref:HSF-type DNA-binding domain-containing protein n=1 Tax=Paramecium pentaurelia TaxID=43138 RepID=A0A8S1U7J9_9CILI|nr:unnamed protein product [Paramecium pentaurelia]
MQQLQIHKQDADLTQRKFDKNQGFISKLKKMLLDQKFKDIIYILESNDGFIIMNLQQFIKQVLPEQFKQINYQSFRRQLNYYGFKCLNKEKNSVEYVNKQFNIHSETQIKKIIKQNSEVNYFETSFNQLEELRLNQLILHKQIEEIKILQEKIMKNTQNNTIVIFLQISLEIFTILNQK